MKPTVLVVDDSPVDRQLIGALMESEDEYFLQYAENGRRALEEIRNAAPDLVVTDLQ
ncbi:MAG: response regulator, partial [Gemmatimonadetes bacterium]|nr:response regulator [Gemmatimonadota bacterium]